MTSEYPTRMMVDSDTPGDPECRTIPDRRRSPTAPLDALRLAGRRADVRREVERQSAYFLDRFDAFVLALIVSILGLTIIDGMLTVELLEAHCVEANPVMNFMLHYGYGSFFVAKYVLTALGLPFLLVFKNHLLFGTRFRVGYVFPVILVLYLVLVAYEMRLLETGQATIAEGVRGERSTALETRKEQGPSRTEPCGSFRWNADLTAEPEVGQHLREAAVVVPE